MEGKFYTVILSVDGLLQHGALHFVKRLSANLASRSEKSFSDVFTFCLFTVTVCFSLFCQRVFKRIWRSGLGFDDGAPLQFVIQYATYATDHEQLKFFLIVLNN